MRAAAIIRVAELAAAGLKAHGTRDWSQLHGPWRPMTRESKHFLIWDIRRLGCSSVLKRLTLSVRTSHTAGFALQGFAVCTFAHHNSRKRPNCGIPTALYTSHFSMMRLLHSSAAAQAAAGAHSSSQCNRMAVASAPARVVMLRPSIPCGRRTSNALHLMRAATVSRRPNCICTPRLES